MTEKMNSDRIESMNALTTVQRENERESKKKTDSEIVGQHRMLYVWYKKKQ